MNINFGNNFYAAQNDSYFWDLIVAIIGSILGFLRI